MVDESLWTETTCVVYIIQCIQLLYLSQFGPEIWNQTWLLTRKHNSVAPQYKAKLESVSINDTSREAATNTCIRLLIVSSVSLIVWRPKSLHLQLSYGNWCDVTQCRLCLHLQSFQQASAKPKRNNFRKSTGVPTCFFCPRVNSTTYHPTQTCCFYNHPESTKILKQDIWRGEKNPPSTLFSG